MGPAVKTPADIIVIRETVKGNSDSKEMQRTQPQDFVRVLWDRELNIPRS